MFEQRLGEVVASLMLLLTVSLSACAPPTTSATYPGKGNISEGLSADMVVERWGQPDATLSGMDMHQVANLAVSTTDMIEYHYNGPEGKQYHIYVGENTDNVERIIVTEGN